MLTLTDKQIINIWKIIEINHANYLAKEGVLLPKIKNKEGKYTKEALVLIYLARNYPNTKITTKIELTQFVKHYYPNISDVQQARHLGMQSGWNIISGQRGDLINDKRIPAGSYKLLNLTHPYHAFFKDRRKGFSGDFEAIKAKYSNRCACCGAIEHLPHWFRKDIKVELQKGHMNPNLQLDENNIIPQCQICNRADRNKWIYDKTGRVIEIADSEDGFRIVNKFIKRVYKIHSKEDIIKKIFN